MAESYVSEDGDFIESGSDDEEVLEFFRKIGAVGYGDADPDYLKCTDPHVLAYQKEIEAYEGFFVTDDENVTTGFGWILPSGPDSVDRAVAATRCAIERYNEYASEPLEFAELVRSNVRMSHGCMRFLTFRATNGKFYETKVGMDRDVMYEFCFLREAKYYPNLDSSSSSSSSSSPPPSESD